MKIELKSVEFPGSLERERIVLRANDETNISRYAIFTGEVGDKGELLGGPIENAYWFGTQPMKPGDLAILYSKSGRRSEKKNEDGTTSYFFYWNLNAPIWATGEFIPVLVSTPTWEYLGEDQATAEPEKKKESGA